MNRRRRRRRRECLANAYIITHYNRRNCDVIILFIRDMRIDSFEGMPNGLRGGVFFLKKKKNAFTPKVSLLRPPIIVTLIGRSFF